MTTRAILLFCFSLAHPVASQSLRPSIDSFIEQYMAQHHVAGLAACTFSQGKITWQGGYGYRNIEQNRPVTPETVFAVASCSKPVTMTALMQLWAMGKFKLSDDINRYLPFRVSNPNHPRIPITFAQLLHHRSSIQDNLTYLNQYWNVNQGDPTIPLHQFLRDYLSVGGKAYDENKNFYHYRPDSLTNYSNIGYALAGYLVERISGMAFPQYCQQYLFKPLHMSHSGWYLRDVDSNQVAMPYRYSDSLQRHIPLGHGGYPDYPAGQLRTSAAEFAHFLIAWTHQGHYAGQNVFAASIPALVTPVDFSLGFYTWFLHATDRGELLYAHPGSDTGVTAFIGWSATKKKGVVLLINTDKLRLPRSLISALYHQTP